MKLNGCFAVACLLVSFLPTGVVQAHPGDGIVITPDGTIYFADVSRETIWKWTADDKLTEVRNNCWTHSLYFSSDGSLYYEREVPGEDFWPASLWKMTPQGKHVRIIQPQADRSQFAGGPFVIDEEGGVYFGHVPRGLKRSRLMKRSMAGEVSVVSGLGTGELFKDGSRDTATIRMITGMTRGPDGSIYFADRDRIRRLTSDGMLTTVASGLLDEKPSDPPQKRGPPTTINRLYGLTVAKDGTVYVAYHSGRRVIRIAKDGRTRNVYQTSRPWAPVGVAIHKGALYVLDSGPRPGSWGESGPRIVRVDLATGKSAVIVQVNR